MAALPFKVFRKSLVTLYLCATFFMLIKLELENTAPTIQYTVVFFNVQYK
jgi:hypothetical protein